MKQKAYIFVFDSMADWEPSYISCVIHQSRQYEVVTVGFSDRPITTRGGLRIIPDVALNAIRPIEAAIFILSGGDMWDISEQREDEKLLDVLREFYAAEIPVAAICSGTLEVVRAGLTRNVRHTSNALEYIKTFVSDYRDEDYYVNELAVTNGSLITASGLGSIEFAREIIRRLGIYNERDAGLWFEMFKHGVYHPLPS